MLACLRSVGGPPPSHRLHSSPSTMRRSYRLAFWLIIWLCVSFLLFNLIVLTVNPDPTAHDDARGIEKAGHGVAGEEERATNPTWGRHQDPHLINTSGCRVPNPPFNPSGIRELTRRLDPFVCPCSSNRGLTYVGDNRTVVVNINVLIYVGRKHVTNLSSDFHCCMWNMYRQEVEIDDSILRFPKHCITFRKSIQASSDYVKVDCFADKERVYETFHIIPMRHPKVEERCAKVLAEEQNDHRPPPATTTTTTTTNRANHCSKNEERLNVVILLLDSLSRFNFHRSLPNSYSYLVDNLDAIELDAYSRVGENTFPNTMSLWMGMSESELRATCWPNSHIPFDNCSFLWDDFAAAGYRTALVEDQPDIGVFHYEKRGFLRQPTDYYGHAFFSEVFKLTARQNDCLNDKMETEYLLQWAFDLKRLFGRGERFFGVFFASRYTHHFINHAQWVDEPLVRHLTKLKTSGLLNDTLLIVMGDHGPRFGAFRQSELGNYEVNLPASFLVFPPEFKRRHRRLIDTARHNARNRLLTHYDVHQTLRDILHCGYNDPARFPDDSSTDAGPRPWPRGISLFEPIPEGRTCADAGIPTEYCPCQRSSVPLAVDSPEALDAARTILESINSWTLPERARCAKFSLARILSVRSIVMASPLEDGDRLLYEVVVDVAPGGGRFQGTVTKWSKSGDLQAQSGISRLDMYGNSSACIKGAASLRVFCFCV